MKILKIFVLLCSFFIYNSILADDDYEHENKSKHHIFRSLEYLNLDEIQYRKIREILIEYKKDYQKFYHYKSAKQKELEKLMQDDTFDKEQYIKIHNEIKIYSVEIEADKFERIHEVLTSKQRVKFSYFLEEWEIE
jgi:protein CpxP